MKTRIIPMPLSGGGGGGYVLPTATETRLGGVKIGDGVSVDADGTISVSGGGSNVVEVTQAEYDALENIYENTTYIISDAQAVDLDDYAKQSDLIDIEALVDGKADKVSVEPNPAGSLDSANKRRLPLWNDQGVIIGTEPISCGFGFHKVNGQYRRMLSQSALDFDIYAPTSAGRKDQVLVSNGSGAPVWTNQNSITGGISFWKGTQAEYDAIATKDNSTLYIITD